MLVSKPPKRLVDKLTPLVSEVMGARSGTEFHKFYELEDDDEVLAGARGLLFELMGSTTAERKIKEVLAK